jgi:hypothetical protein
VITSEMISNTSSTWGVSGQELLQTQVGSWRKSQAMLMMTNRPSSAVRAMTAAAGDGRLISFGCEGQSTDAGQAETST